MINRRLGSVQKTLNIPATFARSSTAYNTDGSVVAVGVPRFEADGMMIEEGTSNLLPSVNQNRLVNGTPSVNIYGLTTELVQGGKYTLSGKKCVYADDAVTNPRINIALYYSDGSFTNNWLFNTIPNDDIPHDFVLTVTADSAKTLTKVAFRPLDYSSGTFMHQEYKNLLAEQKPYATSFHPTTRTAESLTIPASALNASEGTIEFDVLSPYINKMRRLLYWGTPTNNIDVVIAEGTAVNKIRLITTQGGVTNQTQDSQTISNSVRTRIGVVLTGTYASLYVGGVLVGTIPFNIALMVNEIFCLGSHTNEGWQANALFSNLRISNKARSDAELAYTGDLRVDQFTTYSLKLTDSLTPNTF